MAVNSYFMSVIVFCNQCLFYYSWGIFGRNPKDKEYATWELYWVCWALKEKPLRFPLGRTFNSSLTENILQPHPTLTHQVENSVMQLYWCLSSKVPHSTVISKQSVRRGVFWRAQWWQSGMVISVTPVPRQFLLHEANDVFWMLLFLHLFRTWLTINWCLKGDTHF